MITFRDVLKNIISRNLKNTLIPVTDTDKKLTEFFMLYDVEYNNGYYIITRETALMMLDDLTFDSKEHKEADFQRTLDKIGE